MFTLSNDKTAYGTLKGLVEALKKDVLDATHQRTRYSERSLDYAKATGAIGAYNLTISLITSTDIWRNGELAEHAPTPRTHYHVSTADGRVYNASDKETVLEWLHAQGVARQDTFELLSLGYHITTCERVDCLTTGHWLAQRVSA